MKDLGGGAHVLGEVDDDGHCDRYFRRYRYVCRCGKAGAWRESVVQARGDHAAHRGDADALEVA